MVVIPDLHITHTCMCQVTSECYATASYAYTKSHHIMYTDYSCPPTHSTREPTITSCVGGGGGGGGGVNRTPYPYTHQVLHSSVGIVVAGLKCSHYRLPVKSHRHKIGHHPLVVCTRYCRRSREKALMNRQTHLPHTGHA